MENPNQSVSFGSNVFLQFKQIKKSLIDILNLSLQSYLLLFVTIIAIIISLFNKELSKRVPVIIIINGMLSIYVIECLLRGNCGTLTWVFLVFNSILVLSLSGIFKADLSFNVNALLLNTSINK